MAQRTIPSILIDHKTFRLEVPELVLEDGEILGIFGKSGAGKTSYMKRIRELLEPGEVHYMSQFDSLLEEITIRQNIELGLAASGHTMTTSKEWEKEHATLLADFEVNKHMNKYPRAMSGGQRKRAEIVRCLLMNPPVLLLDEPFVGIGHLFEAVCTREILKRGEQKTGVTIIVSHDFDLLCTFSSRVMLVDDQGVIGFVPTRQSTWHPENIRTAWTLGVENVLPSHAVSALDTKGLSIVSADQSLGFWGWSAVWGDQNSGTTIRIKKDDVRSVRSALQHGTSYSRVELALPHFQEPLVLTGKGSIDDRQSEYVLGVHDSWVLSA